MQHRTLAAENSRPVSSITQHITACPVGSSSHFITAPTVCLLGVHPLCSALQFSARNVQMLIFPKLFAPQSTTRTLSLNDQSAPLEVKREGGGHTVCQSPPKNNQLTGCLEKRGAQGEHCLLFTASRWGCLWMDDYFQRGAVMVDTAREIIDGWQAVLFTCSLNKLHRSNNNLLKINKALVSLTWVSSGMSFLSIPTCCKNEKWHFNATVTKQCNNQPLFTDVMRSAGYLSNFEELWNPSHSCQESLVDLQPVFTLASLHLEKNFWAREIVKWES